MFRVLILSVFFTAFSSVGLIAQIRMKGKRPDTTQAVLGNDTTLKNLVAFKDSLEKVGPGTEPLKKREEPDTAWPTLLIIGSVLVIAWAGRRAWKRRQNA
jgi:hypothetical protein